MLEDMTFENILQRMLDRVSDKYDKRQNSIIYNALAPIAAELAQGYINLQTIEDRTYADTAMDEDLARRAAERGVLKHQAKPAIRKGIFKTDGGLPLNVPIGSRFTGGDLHFIVTEKIADGKFKLKCEEPGLRGNTYIGPLVPVQYIDGLVSAELADILIPGEDDEDNEPLRERYYASLESKAFGGNISDYKEKTKELHGVGGVKVFPGWNGGGTVKLVIINSDFSKPSSELLDYVQTEMDPTQNQGKGLGIAPIGHVVTVEGATEHIINIETDLTFEDGYTWQDVKPRFKSAIEGYFRELKETWEDEKSLIVRISYIETRALSIDGILDIQNTKINGTTGNLELKNTEIPALGEVVIV